MSQKTASAVFLFVAAIPAAVREKILMGTLFWLRRYAVVFAAAFVVIGAGQLLKGHAAGYAASQAVLWAAMSASVFLATRLVQSHRGRHCTLCRDTPAMR